MAVQCQTQSTFSGASSSPLAWNELLLACPQEQEEIGKQSHIPHSLDHPSAAELQGLWRQYALWLRLFCTLSVTAAVVLQECHLFCCIGSRTAWPHHPGSNWLPSDLKCGGFVWNPLAVEWRALTVICSEGDFEAHVSPENVFSPVSWLLSYVDHSTSLLRWGFFDSFLLDPRMPTTEGRCLRSHCLPVLTKETEHSGYNKGSELGFTFFNCMCIHICA